MGAGEAAGETYLAAAGLARREGDVQGLAHAALGLHTLGRRIWWPPDQLVAVLSEALGAVTTAGAGDRDAAVLRLRLAASLARMLAWHGIDLPRARALTAEAVTQARAVGDLPALAVCLMAQHNAICAPGTAGERRAVAAEVAALAEETRDRELLLEARLLAATDLLDEFARLADATRQRRFRYAALARRAMLALLGGRFAEAERLIGQAAELGEECGEPGARDVAQDQDWDLRAGQGRLGELAGTLPAMIPDPDSAQARGLRAAALLTARSPARPASRDVPAGWGDQPERARKAVTARIRDVIGRIERVHPQLGAHLRATVTTGTRCGYSPPTPTSWRL